MGWSSGSSLFSKIIDSLQEHVEDDELREAIYIDFIDAFEDRDCDTLEECAGEDPAFDRALKEVHPDWYDDEEIDEL